MSKVPTGIAQLDLVTGGGFPASDVTVLATADDRAGSLILGQFLMNGLQQGERTLLVTFERMNSFIENFQQQGLDFQPFHQSAQFYFFNFVPSIRHKVGFLQDYRVLFEEIFKLTQTTHPTRIAFHQIDALINLSNTHLIHLTAERFTSACRSRAARNATCLAQFIKFPDKTHESLAVALQKSAAGYVDLSPTADEQGQKYANVSIRKMPWFDYQDSAARIELGKIVSQSSRDVAA